MAIDDNTSYELTGAQVKDLAAKIKSKAADNVFIGATSAVAGVKGIVPEPQAGDNTKYLKGDGTWTTIVPSLVEMSYGESSAWSKFIAAYNAGSIVYCRASSNSNPATGSQGRKAFMAYVNNATTPTEVEFQYVRSVSSKTDSQQSDQVFVYKLTNASGGTWTVTTRNMAPKIVAGTGMTSTFTTGANGTITLNAESNYSINEVDTKVKWINGKTIYRKTVATGVMPNRTRKLVAHGISNLGFIISMSGSAYGNSTYLPIPYADTTAANSLGIYASSTDLIIFTGQDMSYLTTSYVTLYYTKTTD
jgi:hypothetical protein